jgi:FkbM family methyltransferase
LENRLIDWSQYASHELLLDELTALNRADSVNKTKHWGWVNGMYCAGNDDMISFRFHKGHNYESVTRELWKRLCKGAELVADIGTHSGIFTLDAYKAGAKLVLAVEPHPINFARMVMNLRYNGFDYSGTFFGAAGDEDRDGSLVISDGLFRCHAASRMDVDKKGDQQELPTRLVRVDSVIHTDYWPKLKVVKIDAENFTPNVLLGMERIFSAGFRPDLIIECTESGMGDHLKGLGYKFWRIWETGKIEEVEDLTPYNPGNNYNGTDEDCRNRFASVRGLPDG